MTIQGRTTEEKLAELEMARDARRKADTRLGNVMRAINMAAAAEHGLRPNKYVPAYEIGAGEAADRISAAAQEAYKKEVR